MPSLRSLRIGPVALTNTLTTNILNPAAAGSGVGYTPSASYIILYNIHIVNKTAAPVTFSLWIGATGANAAGTEWFNAEPVKANDYFFWSGRKRLDAADFLVGGSNTSTALTLTADAEVGLA